MATEKSPLSVIFEDLARSLKEAWEEVKESLSIGLKEMLEGITKELDSASVKIPLKYLDWEQAVWYVLKNEVVLSGDVGIHPSSSGEIVLTQVAAVITKKSGEEEKIFESDILLMEGSFTVGVDFVFPSSSGAVGEFLEIKAKRALLQGESFFPRIIQQAVETSSRRPSEGTKKFINDLTSTSNEKMRMYFDEKDEVGYLMVLQDELEKYHVLINDGNAVIYIGQGKAYIKDLDKALIQVGKDSSDMEPRLEIHVNEDD